MKLKKSFESFLNLIEEEVEGTLLEINTVLPGTEEYINKKIKIKTAEGIAKHNAIVEMMNHLWDNDWLTDDVMYQIGYLYGDDPEDWSDADIEEALWKTGKKDSLKEMFEEQYDEELDMDDLYFFEASDDIFEWAVKVKGETFDLNEAGYILPDGTLLDFSGKRQGGSGGVRNEDHRQLPLPIKGSIGGTDLMIAFMKLGAIRMDKNSGLVDIAKTPTRSQLQIIREVWDESGGYLDMVDGDKKEGLEVNHSSSGLRKIREFYSMLEEELEEGIDYYDIGHESSDSQSWVMPSRNADSGDIKYSKIGSGGSLDSFHEKYNPYGDKVQGRIDHQKKIISIAVPPGWTTKDLKYVISLLEMDFPEYKIYKFK